MNQKKTIWRRLEDALTGKGFYIVLFICIAVIGISAWVLLLAETTADDSEVAAVTEDNAMVTQDVLTDVTEDADVTITDGGEEDVMADTTMTPETPDATSAPAPTDSPASATTEKLTFIWPLAGEIATDYSDEELVYSITLADWRTHNGVDIKAQIGTKVMSVANGTVEAVYDDDLYGTTVVISHGSGLVSIYANLAGTPTVEAGDTVSMGTVIGAVGDTAIAETNEVAHLHFAMKLDGVYIDPADHLPER